MQKVYTKIESIVGNVCLLYTSIQLEIGVQSTNTDTIREIRRTMRLEEVREHVARIKEKGNIHQHLDLIAGLPYEDIKSFRKSFDDVYSMRPDQLQLGFLKVLKEMCIRDRIIIVTPSIPLYM